MPESSQPPAAGPPPTPARGEPTRPALHAEAGVAGTPAHIPATYDRQAPFWRPTLLEMTRYLGWRWVLIAPSALLLIAVPVAFIVWPNAALSFLFAWFKPVSFAVAVIVSVIIYQISHVTRMRKEPFCIHCGYSLIGLEDGSTCPECGRRFSLKAVDEFRKDPRWFIERYHTAGRLPSSDAVLNVPSAARGAGATAEPVSSAARPAELAGVRPPLAKPPGR